jgi:hypothetical protein
MTFGKWSLILFSLVLIGVFITQYIIPILALGSPTLVNNVNVTLNSPANNGYSTSANTNFTFNVSWSTSNPNFNLTNCTLWGNFNGTFKANATNATTIVNNVINGINTSVADGAYLWNVYCYNATSHGNYSTSNYTVTVDLTNPVLRNPYPSNNSYINNANVVFNVSFTEQNINYTVNATLYYRKSSQTDWQTQTLQCWNSAPSFACNYSAINLGTAPIWLLDTNVLQFFYNTTDSAGRTGQNGTASAPLLLTLDTTQPTSVTGLAHSDDAPTGYDNDTTLVFNWTAATDANGILNYKIYVSENSGAYVYNGTNNTPLGYSFTGVNGNTYRVNVTANDTAYNENTTGTVSSTTITIDTTSPTTILTVSPTLANNSYTSNNFVYVNVTFTETNPDTCLLQFNNGTASNYTMTRPGSGTNCYINMTSQLDGAWNYSVFVNDSANNWGRNGTYYVTVDTVNPIINETVPVNGGYFNNPSSMTFQVKLTEQNRNNSINVTVYWKLQGAGSYTSNTLNCYGSAPTWVCNITGISTGLTNGQVLQFLFNTTDSAGRTAANGIGASPLNATADTGAPTYTNNNANTTVAGKYDTVLIYAYWTDADTLNTAVLETNETGAAANKTTGCPNYPCTLSGSTSWSNFTWSNSSVAVGTVIAWKIYANDSVGNQNVTSQGTFSTDNTKPTYTNNGTSVSSGSTIGKGTSILLYAQWTDNVRLHGWVVEYNASGTSLANTTFNTTFGTGNWTNYTITTSASAGTTIHARIYVNDTSGNENYTAPTWTWTIDSTAPTYTNNSTNVTSGETIVKGTPIYVSALWADVIQLNKGWMEENITGTTNTSILSDNWTNYTFSTSGLIAGRVYVVRLFANDTSGNENYTAPTWTWTIDGTAPTYANKSDSVSGEAIYSPRKSYILNISWTDNLGNGNVSTVLFNFSSLSTNQTATSLGSSNYSVTLTDLGFGNYTYRWYANDTSGNWNSTIVYTLNITQNTTNPINFYFVNSTPTTVTNGNMTISAGNIVTVNGTSIYPNAGTVTLYSNITTGSTALAQITNPNTTLSSLVGGVYVFIANTTGTVNYTSNSTGPGTFYLTVTSDTTGPTVLLYDSTSGTYSFDNSSSKKSTATVNLKVYVSDGGMTTNEPCFVKIGSVTPINFANYSGSSTAGWCNGTFTVSSATEGMNLMNITVNDTADNPGSNATYYLTVDNTPPVVTLTATPTSGTYNKLSGNRYWVNGTVYDLISMGSSNVTTNNSAFTAYSFNGTNNTAFSIANSTAVSDGYFAITFYYNDSATNTGSASIAFYIDNTPPSSVIGLKNSSTGTYQPSSTQVIEVLVTDVLKTNDTITLYYMTNINQTWLTKTMTGTPGTSTTYSTTIDTSKLSNDMYVIYYITGSDNATNSITNGGSASSPLANITIDQYCGNNGTALTYCKHSGAITWFELWLPQGSIMNTWSSLSGNRTAPKVLESISGTYSYLYYYNTTSWISYDPSVPWSQSDLKYMNNTNNYPYWINMTSTGTIRIS